ncbi:hypothetical protein V1477_011214 [Vespula maculifrons]|uniref:Uncharacterized protein n=3 Tax=Vespula TaxID=7451 RepID=A0A834NHW8_VESGE|nr:hypothetical protein HZH68_004348 [Vespula germanica]KAF7431888.1 hypothetical protein H0235_004812 [Vespula pensylvanica]
MPPVKLGLSGIYSKAGRFFACRELCPVQALRGGTRFLTSLVLYFLFTMTVVLFIAVFVVILVLVVIGISVLGYPDVSNDLLLSTRIDFDANFGKLREENPSFAGPFKTTRPNF